METTSARKKREYYLANKEHENQRNKEYYYANKERISQHRKKYYLANKEQVDQHNRKWNRDNKESHAQYNREYYQANKEHIVQQTKAYAQTPIGREGARKRARKHTYGLTHDAFLVMLQSQDGRCAICEKVFTDGVPPHLDHCHKTGSVRGILCQHCNSGIGFLKDSPDIVSRALAYLNKYTEKERSA
jgi:hypothetical protein